MCLSSCRRIELHVATSSVYLQIETDRSTSLNLSGVDFDSFPSLKEKVYGPSIDIYHVCLYNEDHEIVTDTYLPEKGGFLEVPAGTYDIILYSAGSDVTLVKGHGARAEVLACTSVDVRGSQALISEPEHIFAASMTGVEIPVYSDADQMHVINARTSKVLHSYTMEVTDVDGIERLSDVDMYVSGQLQGRYLWDRRPLEKQCQLHVKPVVDVENRRIYTVFNTFGRYAQGESDVKVNLVVTDNNGRKHQWVFDVTDIVDSPDNDDNEIIMDNGIVIPDTSAGGGFIPDVNDWDDDVTHVPIS